VKQKARKDTKEEKNEDNNKNLPIQLFDSAHLMVPEHSCLMFLTPHIQPPPSKKRKE